MTQTKKIAIIYGTRTGSTEEIAQKIRETLSIQGIASDIFDIDKYFTLSATQLGHFQGFLLGSGIKIGQWTSSMKKFILANKELLNRHKDQLGVFVSCGNAYRPDKVAKAKVDFVDLHMGNWGIEPAISAAFGGVFDFSKASKLGFLSKAALKMVSKSDPDLQLDFKSKNDFRDWQAIQNFAETYAQLF